MPRYVWDGPRPLTRKSSDEVIQPGEAFDATEAELRNFGDRIRSEEPDVCQVVKSDGEVCGRDRPCQYHD
jgi:hypothetical protein